MRRLRSGPLTAVLAVTAAVAAVALALVLSDGGAAAERSTGGAAAPDASPVLAGAGGSPIVVPPPDPVRPQPRPVRFRDSVAIGLPHAGRLMRGTRLPVRGRHFQTWDPILKRVGSRGWRRNGTDDLVRMVIAAAGRYARAEPRARPILVGDLSRTHGGDFGPQYGFVGHSSHQNGLDADIYYPRRDGRQQVPTTVGQVDRRRAQRLVDLFVAAGAETVSWARTSPSPARQASSRPTPATTTICTCASATRAEARPVEAVRTSGCSARRRARRAERRSRPPRAAAARSERPEPLDQVRAAREAGQSIENMCLRGVQWRQTLRRVPGRAHSVLVAMARSDLSR